MASISVWGNVGWIIAVVLVVAGCVYFGRDKDIPRNRRKLGITQNPANEWERKHFHHPYDNN